MPSKLVLGLFISMLIWPREVLDQIIPAGICPIGFQLGAACPLGQCAASIPRYECLNGVCCRDLRPLPQRLQPPVYPTSTGTCIDSAANCALYVRYCRIGCYRRCMRRHCGATCGFCGLGATGTLAPISGIGVGG